MLVIPLSLSIVVGVSGLLTGCAQPAVSGSPEPVGTSAEPGATTPRGTAIRAPSSASPTASSSPASTPATPQGPAATPSAATTAPSPTGLALPALAPPYDTVLGGHGSGRVAYLSFDDGPGPQTEKILDVLAAAGVQATFCQVGSRLADYPDTERRVIDGGHTLCNHSWSHPAKLDTAPAEGINAEISRTQQAFAALGVTSHYFRAPDGDFGQTTTLRQVCQLNQVVPLGWSVDSLDWKKPGAKAIVANVLSAVHPGAVILMHDAGGADRSQTLAALPDVISGLRSAGYTLAPLPAGGVG